MKAAGEKTGAARQTADPVAAGLKNRDEAAAYVAARAGDEDEGIRALAFTRCGLQGGTARLEAREGATLRNTARRETSRE